MISNELEICHIVTIDRGGAEVQLLGLVKEQVLRGNRVEIIFLKGKAELIQEFRHVGAFVNEDFAKKSFLNQVVMLSKRKGQKVTIFHAHLPRAELLCALALQKNEFVVTRHNAEAFFPSAQKTISRLLSRIVEAKAFCIVSISRAVEEFGLQIGEISSKSKKKIIYYGLAKKSILPLNEKRKSTYKLGTISRLVSQKNIPLLLDSLEHLSSQYSLNFEMDIVGRGPMQNELLSYAKDKGLGDKVRWREMIIDTEDFYQSLDLFILTSDYEGFGLVLLEAMSNRIPIVSRRISAIPEVLGNEHPGLVEDSTPAAIAKLIFSILSSQSLQNQIIEFQNSRVLEFTIEKCQQAHQALYQTLLDNHKIDRR
jgi:glycosyltransferase involved in cell wall biosynthesis